MKPLYSQNEFDVAKANDKLPCKCYNCNSTYYKKKKYIKSFLKNPSKNYIRFCSQKCNSESKNKQKILTLAHKMLFYDLEIIPLKMRFNKEK